MTGYIVGLLIEVFNYIVLLYFFALNSIYLMTSIFAYFAHRKYVGRLKSLNMEEIVSSAGAPPITLIAPAFNEETTCVESTKSLLTLNYPEYEIIFVNDGSSDNTLFVMTEAFELALTPRAPTASLVTNTVRGIYRSKRYSNLWVIDKENGGKADALNTGINFCTTPLYCGMDADSLLERDALTRIVRPFLEEGKTIAAGGIIRIVNGCEIKSGEVIKVGLPKNLIARFQVLEYLRAFLAGRMGWDALDATLIISGAFGIFKRSIVVDVNGYSTDTVGEDMELIVKLHRHCLDNNIPYKITYVPDPVAWTECPESLKTLGRQRDRWQRGLMETLKKHKIMLFNRKYGKIGMIAYPYFYFLEMLGPIIEMPGYFIFALSVIIGKASGIYIIAFFMVAFIFGVILSVAAVGLEELTFRRYPRFSDLMKLFWLAVLENFGYRQYLSYWRARGFISGMRNVKGWGKMERKGFGGGAKL